MSGITVDSLTVNEALPSRSRTFAPEVVARVRDLFTGAGGNAPAQNVVIGVFDKEGGARSTLASLNKLLAQSYGEDARRAATVRATEDGKYKAILLNKPAKAKTPKSDNGAQPKAAAVEPKAKA